MEKLTPEKVRAEVTRFWNAFVFRQAEVLEDFYAHESTGFGSASTRPEPGRLAAARRKREYFGGQGKMRYSVDNVDVTMVGENVAIASYTFQFQATRVTSLLGNASDEDIHNGRATQVFAIDTDGCPRIVHEHFSVAVR